MICKSLGLFLFKFSISIMQIIKPIKKQHRNYHISVLKIFGKSKSKLGINFLFIRIYIKSVQRHTIILTITTHYNIIIYYIFKYF
ncbi:unnamed protein product [Paramecium primaurelia]|uniref:Uncharacterized protein n=1 Tax=Paramecium primaurelia TaxID=5886 RepID=A0A8S1KX29_PARPR|nr:unnamed protein product [Paramecium primaurelia]